MSTLIDPAGRVRPYRSYVYGDGAIGLIRDKKIEFTPDTRITTDVVTSLASQFHLTCNARTIGNVVESLRTISGTVPIRYAFPADFTSAYNKFAAAIALIAEIGPQLLPFGVPKSVEGQQATIAMESLARQAQDALPHFPKLSHQDQSAFWHEDAEYLRWILRHARTRAATEPSFTKPGSPAVRFIQAALCLAGLQHPESGHRINPTCAAIADALRRKQGTESARNV